MRTLTKCVLVPCMETFYVQDCQQYRGPGALDRIVDGVQGLIDRMQPFAAASTVSSTSLRPAPQK